MKILINNVILRCELVECPARQIVSDLFFKHSCLRYLTVLQTLNYWMVIFSGWTFVDRLRRRRRIFIDVDKSAVDNDSVDERHQRRRNFHFYIGRRCHQSEKNGRIQHHVKKWFNCHKTFVGWTNKLRHLTRQQQRRNPRFLVPKADRQWFF